MPARHLCSHLGGLLDLPEELRNTLASVYYEVHWLRRKEGSMPLVAHLPRQKGPEKLLDVAMKQAILRTGQYQLAGTLVEGIRQANKDTQPRLYGSVGAGCARSAQVEHRQFVREIRVASLAGEDRQEARAKIPGIYERMSQLEVGASRPRHRDGVDLSGYTPIERLPCIGEPVCIVADGEVLEGVAVEVWGGS